ncbi:hypothetical protein DFH28DRAFT_248641 [Melampsora americana]|nr:hypothetical protein DFH28DRAFT_248641 [Melampsora americana]
MNFYLLILLQTLHKTVAYSSEIIPLSLLNEGGHIKTNLFKVKESGINNFKADDNSREVYSDQNNMIQTVENEISVSFQKKETRFPFIKSYPILVSQFEELLSFSPNLWSKRIIPIFDRINLEEIQIDSMEQCSLILILRQLVKQCKNIPIDAMQIIQTQLAKIEYFKPFPPSQDPNLWSDELRGTQDICTSIMEHHVNSFTTDQDIVGFSSMQESLGDYGITLSRKWTAGQSKELFLLWTSKPLLYQKVNGKIQAVLEAQIAQMIYIKTTKIVPVTNHPTSVMLTKWLISRVKTFREVLFRYIQGLKDDTDMEDFLSIQRQLSKYALTASQNWKPMETKKILLFWSIYMEAYLKSINAEGTDPLIIAVERLVQEDFEGMVSLMDEFLSQINSQPEIKMPFLAQFLEYLVKKPKYKKNCKVAIKALKQHKKSKKSKKSTLFRSLGSVWLNKF